MDITYLPLPSLYFSDCEGLFFFGGVIGSLGTTCAIGNQEMRKEAMLIDEHKFRLSVINLDYLKGGDTPGLVRYKPWKTTTRHRLQQMEPCCNVGRIRGSHTTTFENLKGGDVPVEGHCKSCPLLARKTTVRKVGGGTFPCSRIAGHSYASGFCFFRVAAN